MLSSHQTQRVRHKVDDLSGASSEWEVKRRPRMSIGSLLRFPTRLLRRYRGLVVVIVIFVILWRQLGDVDSSRSLGLGVWRRQKGLSRHRTWPGWEGISRIYAFGDSHSDLGFDPDGAQPNPSNPIGNPAFPGKTANYGANFLGHLAATYNASFVSLYSFAGFGCTVGPRKWPEGTIPPRSLQEQIDDVFLPHYGRSRAKGRWADDDGWGQDDSLFIFYAGTDEYLADYMRRGNDRNVTDVELTIQHYEENLNLVYDYGARNFLVISLPALEESPTIRNSGIPKSLPLFGGELVDYNARLAFAVQSFARDHPDATIFYFDNHRVSVHTRNDKNNYPETSGIKRMEGYCYFYADKFKDVVEDDPACGNPLLDFYWRDEAHHTENYHRLMARLIVQDVLSSLDRTFPLEHF